MSFVEILVILALVLVLFGPDELPKMAKTLGKGLRELRKAGDDLRGTFEQEMVKLDEEPAPRRDPVTQPSSLPPKPGASDDPAAARAAARFAAVGQEPPPAPRPPEAPAAAINSSAAQSAAPEIKLLPAEGTVPREGVEPKPLSPPPAESATQAPPHGQGDAP